MEIDGSAIYRRASRGVHERALAGVTVLHRPDWNEPLVLNETLHVVWTCLKFGGTAEEIASDIVDVLGYDEDVVRRHVDESLRRLADLDLLEQVDA